MGSLNKNSFIAFQGSFNGVAVATNAVDDVAQVAVGSPYVADNYVDIAILANDTATYGINVASVQILTQDNIVLPAVFDPLTSLLRYYPPAGVLLGDVREITYKWDDNLGNASNAASVFIEIIDRPTAWRGLSSSYVCEEVSGDNTGQASYTTLEKYYTDDNTPYVPADTKPNDPGDPDYIAPVTDYVACPLPGSANQIEVYNFMTNGGQTAIDNIKFFKGGVAVYDFNINHQVQSSQPLILSIAADDYDSVVVHAVNTVAGGFCHLYTSAGANNQPSAGSGSGGETFIFLTADLNSGGSSIVLEAF